MPSSPEVPSLRETQAAFLRAMTSGDVSAIAPHIVADGMVVDDRLAVYRNTFVSGLTAALRITFPAVRKLVGEEFFDGVCALFVDSHPPSAAYLNLYGEDFPAFLACLPQTQGISYLGEVAQVEWAVTCALHARDHASLDMRALANANADDLRLIPHPSVSFLRLVAPADTIWRAVLAENAAALAALDMSETGIFLIVERTTEGVNVTRVPEDLWRSGENLARGVTFDAAFANLSSDAVVQYLTQHFTAGRFIGFNEN